MQGLCPAVHLLYQPAAALRHRGPHRARGQPRWVPAVRPCPTPASSTDSGLPADPAAERFDYDVAFDIRDLINLEDAQQEAQLGPNGCEG